MTRPAMLDAYRFSATHAREAIRGGALTATDLTSSCLERIASLEPTLHAWVALDPEPALAQARRVDEALGAGRPVGPLAGIPVALKDIFNTADMPTGMGSPIWTGFTPGNDARVVAQLREADAVLMGKTVTAEFAVHAAGPTVNPHDPARTPGTSSSGAAAAVAAGMVPLALGSQTAGSTVRPASYCGVYGFKPTYGLLPRTGMLKTTDTLDHVACLARTLDDILLCFETLRVRGKDYPYSAQLPEVIELSPEPPAGRARWRVGLVREAVWVWEHAAPYARQALDDLGAQLAETGVEVEAARLPAEVNRIYELHETLYCKCLSYYFQEEFRDHPEQLSDVLRGMIERGRAIPLEAYDAALQEQGRLARVMGEAIGRYDVLLALSSAGEATLGLEDTMRMDTCLVWTFCGMPALNVPLFAGPNGLPFGAQVISRRYQDPLALRFSTFLTRIAEDVMKTAPVLVSSLP